MRNVTCIFCLLLFSCQSNTKSNNQAYKLAITPTAAAPQLYDIVNETILKMEANGQKIENINRSTIGLQYKTSKDSSGNFVVDLSYDNIQVYTKSGQTETELTADNASTSANPIEKMLGILKNAKLSAIITPKGEIKEVKGYKELGDKLMAGFDPSNTYGIAIAKQNWESTIKQQLVDNNLNYLFKIFPDSLVHVGDQWTIPTKYKDQFEFSILNTYTLKEIEGYLATISVKGDVTIESSSSTSMLPNSIPDLSGTQTGRYILNIQTGLPVESNIETSIEGKVQAAGREIPLTIENKVSLKKRK